MDWYYRDGDKQVGPVPDDAMRAIVKAGAISPTTPVWREGLTDWTTLELCELGQIRQTPAPKPFSETSTVPSLFKRRIYAVAIDVALFVLLCVGYSHLLATPLFEGPERPHAWEFHWLAGWIIFSFFWFLFNLSPAGKSPGGLLMQVDVLQKEAPEQSLSCVLIRWAMTWPLMLFCVWMLGNILLTHALVSHRPYYSPNPNSFIFLFALIVVISIVLLLPLVFTKGRKGWHDLCSGSAAQLRGGSSLPKWRSIVTVIVLIGAFMLLGEHVYTGLFGLRYSPDGQCSAWFPATPTQVANEAGYGKLAVDAAVSVFGDDGVLCSLEYMDKKDPTAPIDWAFFESALKGDTGTLEDRDRNDISLDGYPGRHLTIFHRDPGIPSYIKYCEVFDVGPRIYILWTYTYANGDSSAGSRFMGSFRLR